MIFNKVILVFLFFIVFISFGNVNVLHDNNEKFEFEYNLKDYSIKTDSLLDIAATIVDFPESDIYAVNKNGNMLPYKSFFIATPQEGNVQIFVEPLEYKVIKIEKDLIKNTEDKIVLNHKGTWYTEEEYFMLRGLRVAKFFITPFNYNANNKTLTVLLKVKVTIIYPNNKNRSIGHIKHYGDYEEMLKSLVLNYKSAQRYRSSSFSRSRLASPLSTSTKMLSFKVSDGIKGFNETTDYENGIMKVTASDLKKLFGSSVFINSIAVYAANQEELPFSVPKSSEVPTGIEEVPVMRVDMNNNSLFDSTDYLLFYVSSLSDWVTKKDTVHKNESDLTKYGIDFNLNRLAQERTYWILNRGGSKTIKKFNQNITLLSDTTYNCWKRIRYREVRKYLSSNSVNVETEGGLDWVWDRLTRTNKNLVFNPSLEYLNINTSLPGFVSIKKGYSCKDTLTFRLSEDTISLNRSLTGEIKNWPVINSSKDLLFDLSLTNKNLNDSIYSEISYIDLFYNSLISPGKSSTFRFFSDTVAGITTYGLNKLAIGKNYVFRIKDNGLDISLIDTISKSSIDNKHFYWKDSTGVGVQYFVSNESAFIKFPDDYEIVSIGDKSLYERVLLRGSSEKCDYLIITTDDFMFQARELAAHKVKENLFTNPIIVNVKDIYREFSGGTPDYGAIRNFLSYIHNGGWSVAPDYVLFIGAGHYDYKNYLGKNGNIYIPTCQYQNFCVEDFFSNIDYSDKLGSSVPDLFLGRIVARSVDDASNAVAKIIEQESQKSDFSDWRNKIILVADDDRIPDKKKKFKDGIEHYKSTERIGNLVQKQRPSLSLRKVYLFEYPWNDIWEKPGAFNALKSEINNGSGIVCYYGHGSWDAWADENILNKDIIKSISNKGRYPVFTAFSCRVGRFDIPDETSLADEMVNMKDAGAIAFIASTRTANAGPNEGMGKGLFWALYNKDHNLSIGQAYTASKAMVSTSRNRNNERDVVGYNLKRYALIGDPSYRINRITDSIKVEIESEKESVIKALEMVTVKGTIGKFDSTGETVNNSFGVGDDNVAYAQIGFYFPDRDSVKRKDGGDNNSITYSLPGDYIRPDTIVPVVNGKFSANVMMPKRVPFNQKKPILRVYAWNANGTKTALVIKDDFVFSGSNSGDVADKIGPSITIRPIRLDSTGNVSNQWNVAVGADDTITAVLPMVLGIDLWDESGLLVTGSTPGEGLTLEIDGVMRQTAIGNELAIDPDSKGTKGSVEYFIDSAGVAAGFYNLIVSAMDINGNIAQKEIVLRVTNDKDFTLSRVFNFPNPAKYGKSTRFYFDHNRMIEEVGQDIDATIRIYTLTGKMIKIIKHASNGELWDLTDQKGHRLSPNVYLYTISATMNLETGFAENKKKIKSAIKKLVVHPPK